jgi:stage V sporulation protein S
VDGKTSAFFLFVFILLIRKERTIMETLKVSSKSNPNSVAGAIAGGLQENKKVELQAIGAGAVNQSIKAIAIARSFVAAIGVDLSCIPAFCTVMVENEEKTGMKFIIKEDK